MFWHTHTIKRWREDVSGNVTVIFGLCLTGLLAAGGAAIDFGTVLDAQTHAQASLDAATISTLASIKEGKIDNSEKAARSSIEKYIEFNGGAGALASSYKVNEITISLDKSSLLAKASVAISTNFVKVVGINNVDVAITSRAAADIGSTDIDIVFDRSLTMSLPSDPSVPAPISKVYFPETNQTVSCAFACHDDGKVARAKGIKIKIDTVAEEISKFATDLQARGWAGKLFLHSFYGPVKLEVGPTADPKDVVSYFKTPVSLLGDDPWGHSTELDFAYKAAYDNLASMTSAKKFVIFVTDGQHMRSETPYSGDYCTKIKATGAKIFILHTTFDPKSLAVPGLQDPDGTLIPSADIIKRNTNGGKVVDYSGSYMGYFSGTKKNVKNLKDCSSGDGYYYAGTSGTEIADAFTQLLGSLAGGSLRLTN